MRPVKLTEKLNFVPIKLLPRFGEAELGIGTGFFYRFLDSTHFVTARHIVTGRHPDSNELLRRDAGVPDRLTIVVPLHATKDGIEAVKWDSKVVRLYDDDEMQQPKWYEHPGQQRTDVVTMPISGLEETAVLCANDPTLELDLLRLRPGLDVFILGFPRGMTGGAQFPIWKRGSIATEPDIDLDALPKLFIDTATREGMSGAPVFAQETGYWIPEDKDSPSDAKFGTGRRFLGIYSGRVGDDSFQAQLGIVWKPRAVEEIIQSSLVKEAQRAKT